MVEVLDRELAARDLGLTITAEERLEIFGNTRLEDGARDITERWGGTEHFRQQHQRTVTYTREDWLALQKEQADIHLRIATAMTAGTPAATPEVMDLAEEHRQHLIRWFHDCDYETHRTLAAAYRANQRTGRNYDDMVPGLSQYIHDAIHANANRRP